jgi:hypothetical protein
MIGAALVAIGLPLWHASTDEYRKAVIKEWLATLWLRVKFSRDPLACPVCQGSGESVFQSNPVGPPPEDGEEILYEAPPLVMNCSRCKGSGTSYVYTYRFKFLNPLTYEAFERDNDRVTVILGGSSEHIRRK